MMCGHNASDCIDDARLENPAAGADGMRAQINSWVYPNINNGAYRCGLASTQEAYDIANDQLYEHLDKSVPTLRL
eukprot:1133377-Rhodomonas_salina.3